MTASSTLVHTPVPELPGPPVLGHALPLLRQPLRFMRDLRSQGDVVRIRIGPMPAYVVNHPDLIRQIVVTDVHLFQRGLQVEKSRMLLGNGLIMSDGAFHLQQRRLMQPAFRRDRIAAYTEVMGTNAVAHTDGWQDGDLLAMDSQMRSLTVRVLTRTMFSTEIGERAVVEFDRSLPILMDGLTKRFFLPGWYFRLPLPANRRFDAALARMRAMINEIIADYRAAGRDNGDLMSMLLNARDEDTGQGMPDKQVHDEVITMLFAGAESTANGLSWACHLLAQHPEVQQRARAEVDGVLGDRRVAGHADLDGLPYLRRVQSETLRMFPPPFLLSRRPLADIEIGGHLIPAGSNVVFSPYAVHHDPAYYPEPDRFDPDRWLPERAAGRPRTAYIPFIAGVHACIGEAFSWTEMSTVLSAVLHRWELRPAPGRRPVKPILQGTIVPDHLPMVVSRRR
jgi:cytochrome P450